MTMRSYGIMMVGRELGPTEKLLIFTSILILNLLYRPKLDSAPGNDVPSFESIDANSVEDILVVLGDYLIQMAWKHQGYPGRS